MEPVEPKKERKRNQFAKNKTVVPSNPPKNNRVQKVEPVGSLEPRKRVLGTVTESQPNDLI